MWVSVNSMTKSYQIYQKIALLFIFLYQPLMFQSLQPKAFLIGIIIIKALVWLYIYHSGMLNRTKLIIIAFAINLTFIGLIGPQSNLFHLWIARLGHWRYY